MRPIVVPKEIDLPDHLYRTWRALKRFPEGATATQISEVTERNRATESSCLNQLFLLRICSKKRLNPHGGRGKSIVLFKLEASQPEVAN
jgi:hypothetical protein